MKTEGTTSPSGGFSHGAGSQPTYDGGPLAERGDVVVVTINYRLGGTELAEAVAGCYLEQLGIPDGDRAQLLEVPVDALLAAQGSRGALSPVVDGDSLPVPPLDAIRAGQLAHVPIMIGTTRDEQKLYVATSRRDPIDDPALEAQVEAILPRRAKGGAGEVVDVYRRSRTERGLPAGNLDILDAVGTTSRFRPIPPRGRRAAGADDGRVDRVRPDRRARSREHRPMAAVRPDRAQHDDLRPGVPGRDRRFEEERAIWQSLIAKAPA